MDIPRLLKLLNAHSVKYVVIGATAFPAHGYVRDTADIDIFFEPTVGNAECVRETLQEFGYDVTDITIDHLLKTKVLFRGYIVETDTHPFVTGVSDFAEVWRDRLRGVIEGVPTQFAGLDHLIRMKKAAGRGKDLDDLRYLEKIRELKKKKKRKK